MLFKATQAISKNCCIYSYVVFTSIYMHHCWYICYNGLIQIKLNLQIYQFCSLQLLVIGFGLEKLRMRRQLVKVILRKCRIYFSIPFFPVFALKSLDASEISLTADVSLKNCNHCVKSVEKLSFFWSEYGKIPEDFRLMLQFYTPCFQEVWNEKIGQKWLNRIPTSSPRRIIICDLFFDISSKLTCILISTWHQNFAWRGTPLYRK